jgi:hypothetical protein
MLENIRLLSNLSFMGKNNVASNLTSKRDAATYDSNINSPSISSGHLNKIKSEFRKMGFATFGVIQ